MKQNLEYRAEARALLKKHWAQPVLTTLLYSFYIGLIIIPIDMPTKLLSLLVSALYVMVCWPLMYNYGRIFLRFVRKDDNLNNMMLATVDILFEEFKEYKKAVLVPVMRYGMILIGIMLLIVPGLVWMYDFRMAFFVANDYPTLSPIECLAKSQAIMKGNRKQLFKLDLSFIGWGLLCIITLGIGFYWLAPYRITATARFYEDAKAEYEAKNGSI